MPDFDLLLAFLDDFSPTAIEEHETGARVFFATPQMRDAALAAVAALKAPRCKAGSIDVDDEDWARRSQENLPPVTVGRITVFPNPQSLTPNPSLLHLVVPASMAFGTGHHATTRLCLAALQRIDLGGAIVLDVGTGAGILALAAVRLGAARAVGIDHDPDAIQIARENLSLNPEAHHVSFEVADLAAAPLPVADVVIANLTGALLVRTAPVLAGAVRRGGTLIVSGALREERDAVHAAFYEMTTTWEASQDEWIVLVLFK